MRMGTASSRTDSSSPTVDSMARARAARWRLMRWNSRCCRAFVAASNPCQKSPTCHICAHLVKVLLYQRFIFWQGHERGTSGPDQPSKLMFTAVAWLTSKAKAIIAERRHWQKAFANGEYGRLWHLLVLHVMSIGHHDVGTGRYRCPRGPLVAQQSRNKKAIAMANQR